MIIINITQQCCLGVDILMIRKNNMEITIVMLSMLICQLLKYVMLSRCLISWPWPLPPSLPSLCHKYLWPSGKLIKKIPTRKHRNSHFLNAREHLYNRTLPLHSYSHPRSRHTCSVDCHL